MNGIEDLARVVAAAHQVVREVSAGPSPAAPSRTFTQTDDSDPTPPHGITRSWRGIYLVVP